MKKSDLSNYKAVILAGGEGTRLYPVTREIPKPLLLVRKKPIINYLVDLFYFFGIKDIAILINNDFRKDFDWWKKRYYSRNKIKIIEEKKPLGTFGGLWYLKNWISNNFFFFTNGDELKKIDLIEMKKFHQKMEAPATIALVKVPDPHRYGVVLCERGLVQEFLEKPKRPSSKYINSGLYLLSPEIFNYHPGLKFSMIEKELFPKLAREKKLAGLKFNGKWMDCGTWERYEAALKRWR
jgi:NDP-sugar pyrophosphorylase family protein